MKKPHLLILTAAVLAALGGCAGFGNPPPLAEIREPALPDGESVPVQAQWWQALNRPELNRLIEEAWAASPSLQQLSARLEQAQAQLDAVQAAGRIQTGLMANGAAMLNGETPDVSRYNPSATPNRLLGLGNLFAQALWQPDFWGKHRAQADALLGTQQALAYEAAQTRLLTAHAVTAQYIALQHTAAQQALLQQRLQLARESEQLAAGRIRAGLLPPASLYPLQQAQQQLQTEIQRLDLEAARLRHALSVTAGKLPDEWQPQMPATLPDVPSVATGRLKADLLGKRPDIAAQRALLSARSHSIAAAKAEFYPNIEIRLLAGLSRIDAFDLIRHNSRTAGILPALTLPLFDSPALQANLAGKHAGYNEQAAQYRQTVQNAMQSAADALSAYEYGRLRLLQQQQAVRSAALSAQALQRRVAAGLEHKTAYLEQQDKWLQQQAVLIQLHSSLLTDWSNLNAQFGGGFQTAPAHDAQP